MKMYCNFQNYLIKDKRVLENNHKLNFGAKPLRKKN